jgi:type IV pilus biogenesis/stability protein PilW
MRLFRLSVIFLLAVGLFATACSKNKVSDDDQKKATGYFEMAVAYMNGGDATGALDQLLKATALNPFDPEIENALGLVYYSKEKFDKAITHFQKAIELDPHHSDAHHNLGHLFLTQGRFDPAIEEFKKALDNDLYRNRAQTLNALGYCYYKKRDYLKAEQTLRMCIDYDRLYFMAYGNLGKVYLALERFEDARGVLERALELKPLFPDAMLDLGLVYFKIGKKSQAAELWKHVKQLDPHGEFGARADDLLGLFQ